MAFIAVLLSFSNTLNAQSSAEQNNLQSEEVWSEDEWKKAIEDIEYIEQKKEEEEKPKPEREFKIPDARTTWDGSWLKSTKTKVIVIILTLALLIFTLVKLLGKTGNADSKVLSNTLTIEELTEENFIETDLEKLLRLALEANDYRTAVRIIYLGTIQQLNGAGLIAWKKDKTNKDFLREMRKHAQYKTFRDITLAYEIVWYGDRQIELTQFQSLQRIVDSFQQNIRVEPKTK